MQNIVKFAGQEFKVDSSNVEEIRESLETMYPAARHAKVDVVNNADGTQTFNFVESVGVKG